MHKVRKPTNSASLSLRVVAHVEVIIRLICTYDINLMEETAWITTFSPLQLNGTCREIFTTLKLKNIYFSNLYESK